MAIENGADVKMVRMNMMIEQDHHDKLETAKKTTRISKSELVRIALHLLWSSLGDVRNPDPKALCEVLKNAREQINDVEKGLKGKK